MIQPFSAPRAGSPQHLPQQSVARSPVREPRSFARSGQSKRRPAIDLPRPCDRTRGDAVNGRACPAYQPHAKIPANRGSAVRLSACTCGRRGAASSLAPRHRGGDRGRDVGHTDPRWSPEPERAYEVPTPESERERTRSSARAMASHNLGERALNVCGCSSLSSKPTSKTRRSVSIARMRRRATAGVPQGQRSGPRPRGLRVCEQAEELPEAGALRFAAVALAGEGMGTDEAVREAGRELVERPFPGAKRAVVYATTGRSAAPSRADRASSANVIPLRIEIVASRTSSHAGRSERATTSGQGSGA